MGSKPNGSRIPQTARTVRVGEEDRVVAITVGRPGVLGRRIEDGAARSYDLLVDAIDHVAALRVEGDVMRSRGVAIVL